MANGEITIREVYNSQKELKQDFKTLSTKIEDVCKNDVKQDEQIKTLFINHDSCKDKVYAELEKKEKGTNRIEKLLFGLLITVITVLGIAIVNIVVGENDSQKMEKILNNYFIDK